MKKDSQQPSIVIYAADDEQAKMQVKIGNLRKFFPRIKSDNNPCAEQN